MKRRRTTEWACPQLSMQKNGEQLVLDLSQEQMAVIEAILGLEYDGPYSVSVYSDAALRALWAQKENPLSERRESMP